MKHRCYIDSKSYRVMDTGRYLRITGWYFDDSGRPADFSAQWGGRPARLTWQRLARPDVAGRFARWNPQADCGFSIQAFPEPDQADGPFTLWAETAGGRVRLLHLTGRQLARLADDSTLSFRIDGTQLDQGKAQVRGWAETCLAGEAVEFSLADGQGRPVEHQLARVLREDVRDAGLLETDDAMCGFTLSFSCPPQEQFRLTLRDSRSAVSVPLSAAGIRRAQKRQSRRSFVALCLRGLTLHNLIRALDYVLHHGFRGLKEHIIARLSTHGIPYSQWYATHKVTEEELAAQREAKLDYSPTISIVVPTYRTPIRFLRDMIESVQAQTYPYWELCIGDGSEGDEELVGTIQAYAAQDSRIKLKVLEKNLGISGNTNGALSLATGDYIGLLDHDDVLPPNALFEVARALNEDDYDVLYTDEDKVSADLSRHDDPNFKPDFSPDLLHSHNYITHFFVARKSIVDAVGGFRSEFDGAQDYDFIFRCTERAGKIKHIPKILYHWRIHGNSVAGDPSSKMYAYEAGKKAVEEHLRRIGIRDAVVEHTNMWGMYHVIYSTEPNPLVSIIIPNKDHIDDLDKCVQSIYRKSTYQNIEFIVVENNSTDPATFAYYERMQQEHPNFRVLTWTEGFNYSAINNFGVKSARGDYLLFLNNDTELISPAGISELLGCCMRPDVGIAGAKLYFGDDTIQHAGVVVGLSGFAGHVFTGFPKSYYGFMMRARISGNYSAVTGACLMADRKAFEQVGGFSEDFVVALNDIDFCLKVRRLGLLVVFDAFSEWHHYESKSGATRTQKKRSPASRGRFSDSRPSGPTFSGTAIPITTPISATTSGPSP